MVSSIYLREQLDFVTSRVIEEDFPQYVFANGTIVDIDATTPRGFETYSYRIMRKQGTAAILANGSEDIPMVNLNVEKKYGSFYTLSNGFGYTIMDLERAQAAQTNLDAQLAVASREVMEAEFDDILTVGKDPYDLQGFVDYPGINEYTVVADGNENGGVNSPLWIHKTPQQIYRDLRRSAAEMRTLTKGVFFPAAYIMPQTQFDIIAETPYPDNQGDETILSFFLKTQAASPMGVQTIFPVQKLAGAFTGGTDGIIGYTKSTVNLEAKIQQGGYRLLPPHSTLIGFEMAALMGVGGNVIYKPLTMNRVIGI